MSAGRRAQRVLPDAPTLIEENAQRALGRRRIAGIDEAGRGAWAGPVVAAAVILPESREVPESLRQVNDSKQLTAARRVALRAQIEQAALAWAVGCASNQEIDALGIVPATRLAMMRAVAGLAVFPDALLIDAVKLPDLPVAQRSFFFADAISLSVAAASILAKTARDAMLRAADTAHGGYGFAAHKGYGTRAHQRALEALGACALHRMSFKPLRDLIETSQVGPQNLGRQQFLGANP